MVRGKSWSEVLEENGYGDAGEGVDHPHSTKQADARRAQFNETAAELATAFKSAGKLPGGESGESFGRAASERALVSARAVADSTDSADELEEIAVDMHRALGASLSDNERAAVDALRNAAYAARGGDPSIFENAAPSSELDPRVRTDSRPTELERKKRTEINRLQNKRRQLENKENASVDGDLNRQNEIQQLKTQTAMIEAADSEDQIRTATGRLTQDAATEFIHGVAEQARENNKTTLATETEGQA